MKKILLAFLFLGAAPLIISTNVHAQSIDQIDASHPLIGGQRYLGPHYYVKHGWVTGPEGKKYYYDEDGNLVKGLVSIDKKLYYFDENGVMQTGLIYPNIKCRGFELYYFDNTGAAVTNTWETVNGKKYYFGSDGDGYSCRVERIDGKFYAFTKDGSVDTQTTGIAQFLNMDNLPGAKDQYLSYYLVNGEVQTGWQRPLITGEPEEAYVENYQYYSPETGQMLYGWQKIDGKTYYFQMTDCGNTDGTMLTGIHTIDGKTYEFGEDGALKREIS